MLKPPFPVGFLHIQLLVLLLAPGLHVALICPPFSSHYPLILLPLGRHFRLCCFPKMHATMDIKFGCDFSRFWSPLGSHDLPFGSLKVAKMAPKMGSQSDLAANSNGASLFSPFWLRLASFLAPICCLLRSFSDHLGIIFSIPLPHCFLYFLSVWGAGFRVALARRAPALRAQQIKWFCKFTGLESKRQALKKTTPVYGTASHLTTVFMENTLALSPCASTVHKSNPYAVKPSPGLVVSALLASLCDTAGTKDWLRYC